MVILMTPSLAFASQFYTVQISSPQKEGQARILVEKLKAEGVDSFEAKVVIKGKKHYRVCSGYFENPAMAKVARKSIVKLTHRKNVFVQKLKGSALPDNMVLGDFD